MTTTQSHDDAYFELLSPEDYDEAAGASIAYDIGRALGSALRALENCIFD